MAWYNFIENNKAVLELTQKLEDVETSSLAEKAELEAAIEQFQNIIGNYDQRFKLYKQTIESLEQTVSEVTQEYQTAQAGLRDMEVNLVDAGCLIEKLTKDIQLMQEDKNRLEEDYLGLKKELLADKEKLTHQLREAEKELQEAENQLQEAEKVAVEDQSIYEKLAKLSDAQEYELEKKDVIIRRLNTEIEQLKKALHDIEIRPTNQEMLQSQIQQLKSHRNQWREFALKLHETHPSKPVYRRLVPTLPFEKS